MYPPSDVCKGPKIYQVTLNKHDHIWFIAHISGKIDEFIYLSQDDDDDDDDDDQYDNDYHDHQNYDDIDDIFATLPLLLMDNPFDVDQLRKIQARCNNDYVDMVAIAYIVDPISSIAILTFGKRQSMSDSSNLDWMPILCKQW